MIDLTREQLRVDIHRTKRAEEFVRQTHITLITFKHTSFIIIFTGCIWWSVSCWNTRQIKTHNLAKLNQMTHFRIWFVTKYTSLNPTRRFKLSISAHFRTAQKVEFMTYNTAKVTKFHLHVMKTYCFVHRNNKDFRLNSPAMLCRVIKNMELIIKTYKACIQAHLY